jgi:hypothetical protein
MVPVTAMHCSPASVSEDAARVMRQALAGMLWCKQYYSYDIGRWVAEHGENYAGRSRVLVLRA